MDHTPPAMTRRLFRVEEAAQLLSIGRTTAYALIATGQLHAVHLGRATRISGDEIDRFVRSLDRLDRQPETQLNSDIAADIVG